MLEIHAVDHSTTAQRFGLGGSFVQHRCMRNQTPTASTAINPIYWALDILGNLSIQD
jgi:hypothetical protein